MNIGYTCITKILHYVNDVIIHRRRELVEDFLYTNSQYFAGQAWRFQLVLWTPLSKPVLSFLLRAHTLKYNEKRKAFVKKNAVGFTSKIYPVTEERRYQVVSFIRAVKQLAEVGIRVHFVAKADFRCSDARAAFKHQPPDLQHALNMVPDLQHAHDIDPQEAPDPNVGQHNRTQREIQEKIVEQWLKEQSAKEHEQLSEGHSAEEQSSEEEWREEQLPEEALLEGDSSDNLPNHDR